MSNHSYRSIVTPKFRDMLDKLPEHVQKQAREGFNTWKRDPTLVGWKRLTGMKNNADVFSVEIGLRYRAIGVLSKEHNAVVWMFVGSHETYNNYIEIRRSLTQDKWLGHNILERLKQQRTAVQPAAPTAPRP